ASPGARIALAYITVGSLTVVWTTIWYLYLEHHGAQYQGIWYLVAGLFISGLTLLVIGFGLGWIGRNARQADQPTPAPTGGKKDEKASAAPPPAAPGTTPTMPYPPGTYAAPPGIPVASAPAPNGPAAPANPPAPAPGSPAR